MSDYEITQIDGLLHEPAIHRMNAAVQEWPLLTNRHLVNGFWWLIHFGDEVVGFAGMVPMHPFEKYGYLKRCYVHPSHLGHGLQNRLLLARELKAKQIGWTHLISESTSRYSNSNFAKAGFIKCDPEQKWAGEDATYWVKKLI